MLQIGCQELKPAEQIDYTQTSETPIDQTLPNHWHRFAKPSPKRSGKAMDGSGRGFSQQRPPLTYHDLVLVAGGTPPAALFNLVINHTESDDLARDFTPVVFIGRQEQTRKDVWNEEHPPKEATTIVSCLDP